MRARHRHFKYRAAGAAVAFDARYIQSVSDNTSVETWDDLSGNARNATQSTPASRALYRTNIQGGSPVLRFDGSNDWYIINHEILLNSLSVFAVFKNNGLNQRLLDQRGTGAAGAVIGWHFKPRNNSFDGFIIDDGAGNFRATADSVDTNFHIATGTYSNGSVNYYIDGVIKNTFTGSAGASVGSIQTTKRIYIGANVNGQNTQIYSGDAGLLVVYGKNHEAALRRRLEHAAAYSFKIACS